MSEPVSCPEQLHWEELLVTDLPPEQQSALGEHLESCTHCQQTLERLAAGYETWARAARRLGKVGHGGEAALQRAVAELEGEPLLLTTPAEGGVAEERRLDFLSPADRPELLGRLGHYEVSAVIGCGSMGVVLKAFDQTLRRVVAIKVMASQLATSANARKRFIREAQAAAAVRNEHIIDIHAVEGASERPYLVMEYVCGISLQQRLSQAGPLEVKEVLRIGMQIAAGLAAAHAQGLVHRDVKPANILLENGLQRVKLTDFGLARAVDDATITQSGVVAGTPMYMAPEQARGEAVDHRADLFSLGSVLYALCTGGAPFRASGTMAVLKRVCEDTPRPIHEINPEVPAWLVAIIGWLHAKDPAQRPQSAAEVAELLSTHLAALQQPAGIAIPRVPLSPSKRARAPRRWRAVAAALVLLLAGLALTELAGITRMAATALRILTREMVQESLEPAGQTRAPFQFEPPAPGLLDRLDPARIAAAERFPWQPRELVAVLGEHRGRPWDAVVCVAFSPDGKRAASCGWEHSVYVWDADTLRLRALLIGHTRSSWGVAFSPDGRRLLSASEDETVRLWDLDTGRELRRFVGHNGPVWSVAYSPDGRRALSGGDDHTLRLWDIEKGTELACFEGHTAGVNSVAFSSDGAHVLSGSMDRNLRLWSLKTGREVRCFGGHSSCFRMTFLPDGRHALSASNDRSVRLWNVHTGQEVRRFEGHTDRVFYVAISPDGRRALSCGEDRTIRMWNVQTGHELRRLQCRAAVSSVAFSPDGRRALSATGDGNLCLWDLESGKALHFPVGFRTGPALLRLAFSSDGRRLLVTTRDDFMRLWDVAGGREQHRLEIPCTIWGVAFSADGRQVLGAGGGGMALWDADSGRQLHRFADARGIWDAALTRDGRRVVTAGRDGNVRVWNAQSGRELSCFHGHPGDVYSVAVAPDGARAVSGYRDGGVRLWDLEAGGERHQLQARGAVVWGVTFSPDGRHVAAGDSDGFVRLWDVTGAEPRVRSLLRWHAGGVCAVAFSPDAQVLVSAGGDGRIILWDVPTGARRHEWHLPGAVQGVTFAPDGRHLAAANGNGTVYILRLSKALAAARMQVS